MIRHIYWEYSNASDFVSRKEHGLVAVKLEGWETYDTLILRTLNGRDLPSCMLFPVLDLVLREALGEDWIEKIEKLHQSRKNKWTVNIRYGMSGCCDLSLYILEDEDWLDQPKVAQLHESMAGKLNEGLHCQLINLPPLLATLIRITPPAHKESYFLRVWEPRLREEYEEPGASSGLQEALEALKALEVISD